MEQLLTPKLDLVFKLLFIQDTDILIDLVNTVLDFPAHLHIREIEVKNPTVLPEELEQKFIILDILAVDDQNRQYDIEMQVQRESSYAQRSVYYLSRLYASQLEAGDQYHRLCPVIGIHFLDYTQFPEPAHTEEWQWCFELRDVRHPEVRLTGDLSLYLFELPKFERLHRSDAWGKKLFEWLHFFNHAHEEGDNAMQKQYTNPAIHQAFQRLERLSADERIRRQAEIRERALRNEHLALAAEREEGRKEGRKEGLEEGRKEGLEEGLEKGHQKGLDKGEVIGEIRMLQRILHRQVSTKEELAGKALTELQALLQALEQELPS